MSQQVRTSNLFAAEQWETVYKSFKDVDFRAYDYDSLKQSLIDYLKEYYPEDFNDYIESSEYIAIIELLAWLGTSLAFRVDLNSRENFLATAERRESIIRLARMLSYQPKRNIAAKGLFKIVGVQTTQPLLDSFGRSLQNTTVFWNDPNNPDSFDQFVQIMNNIYIASNPFGRPVKDGTIGGIKTSLYQMNDVTGINVAHPVNITVNSVQMPFEVVNPDFNDGETIFERDPDPSNAMHVLYRNDGQGFASAHTGFFFHFKQGSMVRQDNQFDFPKQNRIVDVGFTDINNDDVWVQEINQDGAVQEQWTKVPSVSGSNIAYNDIDQLDREIFSVISGLEDSIQIKYSDGNLGKVPTGIFRTWARTSINQSFIMRTDEARDLEISVPYIGRDNQQYQARFIFQLEENISNSSPSETNDEIKERAPRVYYSQDRMVNNQDYNVFPLAFGNQIKKLTTINRTHSGHSRFIDINDPTGTYSKVILFGEDGVIFKDDEMSVLEVEINDTSDLFNLVTVNVQNFLLNDQNIVNWFYDEYATEYENKSTLGEDVFTIPRPTIGEDGSLVPGKITYFKNKPDSFRNDTGYFTTNRADPQPSGVALGLVDPKDGYEFMKEGSYVFTDLLSGVIDSVKGVGLPSASSFETTGPVAMSTQYTDLAKINKILPAFRREFNNDEALSISEKMLEGKTFYLYYTINDGGRWDVLSEDQINDPVTEDFTLQRSPTNGIYAVSIPEQSWVIEAIHRSPDNENPYPKYTFRIRGTRYIFESVEEVRFFHDVNQDTFDPETGKSLEDEIVILKGVNSKDGEILNEDVVFNIHEPFIYEDGHQDQRRVSVLPEDPDQDGIPDNPTAFREVVGSPFLENASFAYLNLENVVISQSFTDIDGYVYYQPYRGSIFDLRNTFSVTDMKLYSEMDLVIIRAGTLGAFADFLNDTDNVSEEIRETMIGLVVYEEPAINGRLRSNLGFYTNAATLLDNEVTFESTKSFKIHNGRTFLQNTFNTSDLTDPIHFKWKHYAPTTNRIDPSVGNIMDMTVLTNAYYQEVLGWKDENKSLYEMPQAPSTEDLRLQFSGLNEFKMLSDQLVFKSGTFKPLFGTQALPELRATFKVVKIPTTLMNENEIKTEIIKAIDTFFSIDNWDYGESFYFTELAAYVHQQLASAVSSVVIVPSKEDSQFGNLFQIKAEATELFISTASVADIEIVENLTETNLRV